MKRILKLIAIIMISIVTFLWVSCLLDDYFGWSESVAEGATLGYDPNTEVVYSAGIAEKMIGEIKQCRMKDELVAELEYKIKLDEEIIAGKDEIIKLKDEIISLKDKQITTLKAAEVVQQLEGVISVQRSLIDDMKPSGATGLARFALVILSIFTFGMIHP